jgi:sulfate transport system substrate-binding protein
VGALAFGDAVKQAMGVRECLEAVVLTLACDIGVPVESMPIPADWQKQFPNGSSPYTSSLGERHAAD